jgi:hypothetical protein
MEGSWAGRKSELWLRGLKPVVQRIIERSPKRLFILKITGFLPVWTSRAQFEFEPFTYSRPLQRRSYRVQPKFCHHRGGCRGAQLCDGCRSALSPLRLAGCGELHLVSARPTLDGPKA